jgi:hypothetical protein
VSAWIAAFFSFSNSSNWAVACVNDSQLPSSRPCLRRYLLLEPLLAH